ncbi:GIY-YIG nuclease family protein [Winogradskyella ouciana]|uniref:Nucleotide excision repair endonuclease n=1 Tax=Winogradskyella ouciana TaxID=2608631 RepID=A0A7K1GET7_9FLAO|nr:GIY-YIG nuclease family protein [Winogradskyella ouciana]MTE27555.1 nucleotide excision repair endonuclease [Winogradskyella ouciana]
MLFIYIKTIPFRKKASLPYEIIVGNEEIHTLKFKPHYTVPKKIFSQQKLNRLEINSAPPFSDVADELIYLIQENDLIFSNPTQFRLLKSLFKSIGYNFEVKCKYVWYNEAQQNKFYKTHHIDSNQIKNLYPEELIHFFTSIVLHKNEAISSLKALESQNQEYDWSSFKTQPGVYFFKNENDEVIYIGKAKYIRKRLQSHFSKASKSNSVNYSEVKEIDVEYTGNDVIAQLVESFQIKKHNPKYNTQQINNAAPFIINRTKTAKGISKLKIVRKDHIDNMPEKFFNRQSVKDELERFCNTYNLCRKHCSLETVKGPCSNYTVNKEACVCASLESIEDYNQRFERAFEKFQAEKHRTILKLRGRHTGEDAFIYLVNGIYEGYGYIDKDDTINNFNDILGKLISQPNNYDTARIIRSYLNNISKEDNLITIY